MKPKIGIVIGHDPNEQGAYSWWLEESEFPFNKQFDCQINADVLYRKPRKKGFGYYHQMRELASRTKNYDVLAELHFNASEGGIANGAEVLHWVTNEFGKEASNKFLELLTKEMPEMRNRGAKAIYRKSQRGYWFHALMSATTLHIEPFFGDNYKDKQRFKINKYVDVINEWIKWIEENYQK